MPPSIDRLRAALAAYRPLAHGNLVVPLLVGESRAFAEGALSLREAVALHLFLLPLQGVIVFANDLADETSDTGERSLVSGGSGVLQEGRLSRSDLVRLLAGSAVLCVAWSAYACVRLAPLFALAPLAAGLAVAAYELPPLRAGRSPLGALVQTLAMGVGLPCMAYYGATGRIGGWAAVAMLTPYAFGSHLATALPDEAADAASGKRTLVVVMGANRAAWTMAAAFGTACVVTMAVGGWSTWVLGLFGVAIGAACGMAKTMPERARERGAMTFAVLALASAGMLVGAWGSMRPA